MDSEDGVRFIKYLADFVRKHERALANALRLTSQNNKNAQQQTNAGAAGAAAAAAPVATPITLSEALSPSLLSFSSTKTKYAKLALTPHHLFYLLSKFEELGVDVGPMSVRLENLQNDTAPSNYVSFLGHAPRSRGRQADSESLRSVSSMRSVMSSVSSLWSSLTLSHRAAKTDKQMTQYREDIRYLYSSFTKIPALRLCPDPHAPLVAGFEEFPFDTAVPLFAFKNVSTLDICDLDFRQFYGWDRLAEQLRVLTLRRASLDDPIDLLQHVVLDDMEKRRKRSFKTNLPATPSTPGAPWPSNSPRSRQIELSRSMSAPGSPFLDQRLPPRDSPQGMALDRKDSASNATPKGLSQQSDRSNSPTRPSSSRHCSRTKHARGGFDQNRRSSGSSNSSSNETVPRQSTSDLLALGILPPSKWRFLRHLALIENGLHTITTASLAPVASTLYSLDLSGNLFTEVPDALADLTHLRALNLSNCMIDSLQSLSRHPLPAITTLNLRSNRLLNLSGIEKLISLERIDLRDNRLRDPTELARLTGFPDIRELYLIKNPFARTHPNYRITIFNLFRKSPGRVQDVSIDLQGPANNEKKSLVDFTPESAIVPVVRPPLEDEEEQHRTITDADATEIEDKVFNPPSLVEPVRRHGHRRATSDLGPQNLHRRRKAPRRRLVELSTPDSTSSGKSEQVVPDLAEAAPKTPTDSDQPSTPEQTPFHTAPTTQMSTFALPDRPSPSRAFDSPTPAPKIRDASDDDDDDPDVPSHVPSHGDLYHEKKMEPLHTDLVAPQWLTPANNENKTNHESTSPGKNRRSSSPSSRTSTIKAEAVSNRGVSVSGRTLG